MIKVIIYHKLNYNKYFMKYDFNRNQVTNENIKLLRNCHLVTDKSINF